VYSDCVCRLEEINYREKSKRIHQWQKSTVTNHKTTRFNWPPVAGLVSENNSRPAND